MSIAAIQSPETSNMILYTSCTDTLSNLSDIAAESSWAHKPRWPDDELRDLIQPR